MRSKKVKRICFIGIVAAVYATTTIVLAPISFGAIQCRVSEALTLLALLSPDAIIAVTLGCAISNIVSVMMGASIIGFVDVIIGTIATFFAAVVTYQFRNARLKNIPIISALAPVIFNGIFIGMELAYVLAPGNFYAMFWIFGLEVAIGEAIACFVLGVPLVLRLEKLKVMEKLKL